MKKTIKRECSIDGCDRKYECKGFCNKHYLNLYHFGIPQPKKEYTCHSCNKKFTTFIEGKKKKFCSTECLNRPDKCKISKCRAKTIRYQLCYKHYMRWYRNGTTDSQIREPTGKCLQCNGDTKNVFCSSLCATRFSRGWVENEKWNCKTCDATMTRETFYRRSFFCSDTCSLVARAVKAYNLDPQEILTAKRETDGFCKLCQKEMELVIDHNHFTNSFRGLICNKCNMAIGLISDSPDTAERIMNYLKSN